MRIEGLRLSWFRGAGPEVALETKGKSIACFGPNGAGKSTFVDALEYLAGDGKIDHLSHEYSGKSQINGVRNTHAPAASPATIEVTFARDAAITASISSKGTVKIDPSSEQARAALESWRAAQLILRQDEVARFIHATKGEKYSALLPLLGLGDLETVVENLRKLGREISRQARVAELTAQLEGPAEDVSADDARGVLVRLAEKFGVAMDSAGATGKAGGTALDAGSALADSIAAAIQSRLAAVDDDSRRRQLLDSIRELDLAGRSRTAQAAAAKLAESWDQIVRGKVLALEGASEVLSKAKKSATVDCPSCGRPIARKDLAAHVAGELEALRRVREQWQAWESAAAARDAAHRSAGDFGARLGGASEALARALKDLGRDESGASGAVAQRVNPPDLADVARWVESAERLEAAVATEIASVPPPAGELVADNETVTRARTRLDRDAAAARLDSVRTLGGALESIEAAIRAEMHTAAERMLGEISAEVQRLWSRLHPGEPIEDVKLYAPEADKALDVSLKYYGRDQPSPRLTLSEGHRNSLGLCIFLALVRLRAPADRPIVLDDIISSLDREHRGRVIDLLETEFADRQVLLFTHDHEWFVQLSNRLPAKSWTFCKLRPWDNPEIGLRWTATVTKLEEAREQLDSSPEIAASRARASMDEQLQIAAEMLELEVPFLRGERNDHRTGVELLTKLAASAKKCLRTRGGGDAKGPAESIGVWNDAAARLKTVGNLAAHGGSVSKVDAEDLIQACEHALSALRCGQCEEFVWFANEAGKRRQCQCGELVWKLD